ncbi:hypothetical protein CEXT_418631 [Caerostris extrusa]|uniref:Uncharacterized protein n=1 Tax=Caerostris extrusa TaxID=172846 RepID=A0AAV4NUS2_CAEEX|nr:hypothetical protein CEXT_418631 [Caerostris extrusa]
MATADDVKFESQDFGEHSPEAQTISLFIFECLGCEVVGVGLQLSCGPTNGNCRGRQIRISRFWGGRELCNTQRNSHSPEAQTISLFIFEYVGCEGVGDRTSAVVARPMATADDVKFECQDFGEEENFVTLKGIPFHSSEAQTISLFIFECVGCEGVGDRTSAVHSPRRKRYLCSFSNARGVRVGGSDFSCRAARPMATADDVKFECQDFGGGRERCKTQRNSFRSNRRRKRLFFSSWVTSKCRIVFRIDTSLAPFFLFPFFFPDITNNMASWNNEAKPFLSHRKEQANK